MLAQEAGRYSGAPVSRHQLELYANRFGFPLTPSNHQQLTQIVLSARAHAWDAATAQLGQETGDLGHWVEEALTAEAAFVFEAEAVPAVPPTPPSAVPTPVPAAAAAAAAPTVEQPARPGTPLKQAMAECIAAHVKAEA